MTVTVEIMLRANPRVYSESFDHPGDPLTWTPADMAALLREILGRIGRLQGHQAGGPVGLRGMNWIVSPFRDGVVLAFEIHGASAVAGPFHVEASLLESLVAAAFRTAGSGATTVH